MLGADARSGAQMESVQAPAMKSQEGHAMAWFAVWLAVVRRA